MKEFGYTFEEVNALTPDRLKFLQMGLERWYKEEARRYKRMFGR